MFTKYNFFTTTSVFAFFAQTCAKKNKNAKEQHEKYSECTKKLSFFKKQKSKNTGNFDQSCARFFSQGEGQSDFDPRMVGGLPWSGHL